MAYRQPSSTICLLKGCPCDHEYNNTIWYSSRQEQFNGDDTNLGLINLCPHVWFTQQSYQRKGNNSLRIEVNHANYIDFLEYNYLIFSNNNIALNDASTITKATGLFYCFLDTIEYINDNCVEVTYTIDVMQTYMFDYSLGDCYIEREHSATDGLYENLTEEKFSISDYYYSYITQKTTANWCIHIRYVANKDAIIRWYYVGTGDQLDIVFLRNKDIAASFTQENAFLRNNTFTGYFTLTFPLTSSPEINLRIIQGAIEALEEEDGMTTITSISLLPIEFNRHTVIEAIGKDFQTHQSYCEYDYPDADTFTYPDPLATYINVPNITTFYDSLGNNYTPKNKKMYNYPFNQIFVTNNNGETTEIPWENISRVNNVAQFWCIGVLFNTPELRLIPLGCNGISINIDNSIAIKDFPSCAWSYDTSKAQWEQNKASIITGLVSTAILGLSGISMGASVSGTVGAKEMAKAFGAAGLTSPYEKGFISHLTKVDASLPISSREEKPQISRSGKIDLMSLSDKTAKAIDIRNIPSQQKGKESNTQILPLLSSVGFKIYAKTVKPYEARQIDEYFSLYGYAVKQVKTPNLFTSVGTKRPEWYYIKNVYTKVDPHFRLSPQPIIDGYVNEEVDTQLKEIYNKGITFWFNSTHVGDYFRDNSPINP